MKTKLINGKIIIYLGILHALLAIPPLAFNKQFEVLYRSYFNKISDMFSYLKEVFNYESLSAFWFFDFGLLLIPLGFLLNHTERVTKTVPLNFAIIYVLVVVIGVLIVPISGMTLLILPHAIYMMYQAYKINRINKI